jgi:hypothetical protein
MVARKLYLALYSINKLQSFTFEYQCLNFFVLNITNLQKYNFMGNRAVC